MVFYTASKVSPRVTRITDLSGTHFYLVEGTRRAAVIDTGVGCGDPLATVRALTDKPVFAIITHGHLDHAMGAASFDEAYMSPKDRELYARSRDPQARLSFIEQAARRQKRAISMEDLSLSDMMTARPVEDFRPLEPGMVFPLGGVHLEIHEGAGHTPGCVTVLIPEEETLLLGDSCNTFTYLFDESCGSIEDYLNMLLRLESSVRGRYRHVLLNHGSDHQDYTQMIESAIALCRELLSGRSDAVPYSALGLPAFIARKTSFIDGGWHRLDGGLANIVYGIGQLPKV